MSVEINVDSVEVKHTYASRKVCLVLCEDPDDIAKMLANDYGVDKVLDGLERIDILEYLGIEDQ